ncbi:MAG: hypothetical protein ACI9J3_001392 [Parvicellaceae bacterium]|jgi:hypothetical protein
MRKTIKILTITAFFAFGMSVGSFAQVSKTVATTFINAHPTKTVQKVLVNNFYGYVNGNFICDGDVFEASSTVITAMEDCIHIKDGTGKEMYISYSHIKSMGCQPETDKKYSTISINIE